MTERFREDMTYEEFRKAIVDERNEEEGKLHLLDGYNCEICKNKGYILRLDEKINEYAVDCKCRIIRRVLRRAKQSGLGDVLSELTFDKFNTSEDWQKSVKDTAQRFCKDDNAKWFFIGGQVGCGKSHICTAIASHYIKSGYDVKYMLWVDDSKNLKALTNDKEYSKEIGVYKNVDVLYIDDFLYTMHKGEAPTKGDINLAMEIINHRLLDKSKITIISSEKMLDDLIDYSESIMSRIYQEAGEYKISIAPDRAKNYRLK